MRKTELEFELAGSQIDGARKYQEDTFLITQLNSDEGATSALLIVADGMGGHAAGNVASNMAVQECNKYISANYPSEQISTVLRHAAIKANNAIKETIAETPALKSMGCTIVAALLEKNKLWWVSIGDSHLYLLRGKKRLKKNIDHSYGGFLDRTLAAGMPVEPDPSFSRNMLMSALTGEDIHEIDVPEEPFILQPDDRVLLCSDGLDSLSEEQVTACSKESKSPKAYANALMDAVTAANVPRQDNTTVIIADIKLKESTAHPFTQAKQPVAPPFVTPSPAPPKSPHIGAGQYQVHNNSNLKKIIGIAAGIVIITVTAYFLLDKEKYTEPETEFIAEKTAIPATEEPKTDIAQTTPESAQHTTTESLEQSVTHAVDQSSTKAPAKQPEKKAIGKDKIIQDKLRSGGKGPLMVIVPAGEFFMGSRTSRYINELPRHKVMVAPFAISQYEISIAEYNQFAKAVKSATPYKSSKVNPKRYPVTLVTWAAANDYAKWLSRETGNKYRLPSEAEWEYIASTGKRSPFWWGYSEEPGHAHCFDCGEKLNPKKPTELGSFKPNSFGIYDTAGNVSEWVYDCWHANYQDAPKTASVWQGGDCTYRAVRGGAYNSPLQSVRSAKRDKYNPNKEYEHIGIRLVREIK